MPQELVLPVWFQIQETGPKEKMGVTMGLLQTGDMMFSKQTPVMEAPSGVWPL